MMRFILLLAILTAFPPLSTDMYLPAIPSLEKTWNQPLSVINLTLILFFTTYCFFLLIYGPLSDRFGRRPPLITGIILFISGSFLCSFSNSIEMLILSRIIQAAGAASASSISLAIAKDRLKSHQREKVLGYVSVIMALAPMMAPMIGSIILKVLTWPWIFVAQGLVGAIALTGVIITPESNKDKKSVPLKELVKSYIRILKNSNFMLIVISTSISGISFFGFIATSSNIYITIYKLDESIFAILFGANALCFMVGSMICAKYGRIIGSSPMMTTGFAGVFSGGLLMSFMIFDGPFALTIPMGIISLSLGICRPPANNLALEQVKEDAGAASSLLVFIYFMTGALGMAAASIDWSNKVIFIGIEAAVTGLLCSFIWFFVKKRIDI